MLLSRGMSCGCLQVFFEWAGDDRVAVKILKKYFRFPVIERPVAGLAIQTCESDSLADGCDELTLFEASREHLN